MKRIRTIWIGLAVVYAALLAWHQPLRGPLSEDEVRTAFGAQYAEMRLSEDAQARAFLDFFLNDDGRPFHMVNLNALPERSPEADEAAQTYGAFMAPRLLARASYPVLSTDVIVGLTNTLGPGVDNAERLVVVRYRSRRDFLNIISTPEFREAVQHKSASLDGWYSAPSTAAQRCPSRCWHSPLFWRSAESARWGKTTASDGPPPKHKDHNPFITRSTPSKLATKGHQNDKTISCIRFGRRVRTRRAWTCFVGSATRCCRPMRHPMSPDWT
jgi:hypothetical protein